MKKIKILLYILLPILVIVGIFGYGITRNNRVYNLCKERASQMFNHETQYKDWIDSITNCEDNYSGF